MMSVVPVLVDQTSIIRIILGDLFLGQTEPIRVLEITVSHLDELVDVFATERGLTVQGSNRRSHLPEYHHVVLRHVQCILIIDLLC